MDGAGLSRDFDVATIAPMKSGLKDVKRDWHIHTASRSNHCRDEKRTERLTTYLIRLRDLS